MNKEELITKKIDSLKCKGQYDTDIKDSINKMFLHFNKLKHKVLNGNYKVKNHLYSLIHSSVNTAVLKQYKCLGYGDIKNKYEELEKLLIKKNADYGNSFDKTLDEFGINTGLVRIADKINRIANLKDKDEDHIQAEEKLEETILDIAGYSVLFSIYLENNHKEAE